MKSGIYAIVNEEAKAAYIGKSLDTKDRLWNHQGKLRAGKHRNQRLQRAWNKYGEAAFKFVVIEVRLPPLLDAELAHAEAYAATGYALYNLKGCGYGRESVSEETKAKISASLKGRKRSPDSVKKGAATQKGRSYSEETLARMALAHAGKTLPVEQVQKIAAANRGQKRTAETRDKISAAMRGKKKKLTPQAEAARKEQLKAANAARWERYRAAKAASSQ